MKKNILLLIISIISFHIQAQTADDYLYFKNNIHDLDPIEGIYDNESFLVIDDITIGKSNGRWIVKRDKGQHNTFIITATDRSGEAKMSFERLGETNYYRYHNVTNPQMKQTCRLLLVSPNKIHFQVAIPQNFFHNRDEYGYGYETHDLIKIYP